MKKIYAIKNHSIKIRSCLLFFICFFYLQVQGQNSDNTVINVDWDVCKYYPLPNTQKSSIPLPDYLRQKIESGGGCSSFIVNYNGFTPQAEAAFQFAVDIWSNSIESTVPIRVSATFGPLADGILGGAGPTSFRTVSGSGFPSNTAFPIALAEKLIGSELPDGPSPTSIDISAIFSSTANFYFGLDANPPGGQVDFVSVVLHELGHGLGILGFGRVPTDANGNPDPDPPTVGVLRNSGFLSPWDTFIENGAPTAITTFTDPSASLLGEFTGNNLFSNGPITTAQNGNIKPSTYAPFIFNPGSSYSHWDENTYPAGNPTSLMTPFIAPGEAIHDPGLVTLGFMEDMGWSICGGSLTVEKFNASIVDISPNPFNSSISIQLGATQSNDDYSIKIFDINGRVILKTYKALENGEIALFGLDQLENSIYFVEITNGNNGARFTKKIIKN